MASIVLDLAPHPLCLSSQPPDQSPGASPNRERRRRVSCGRQIAREGMRAWSTASLASHPQKHRDGEYDRDHQRAPERRAHESKPSQKDEGAAEERDEEAVAARRVEAEDAVAWAAAGDVVFPDRHRDQAERDEGEE